MQSLTLLAALAVLAARVSCRTLFAPGPAPSVGVMAPDASWRQSRAGATCAATCAGNPLSFTSAESVSSLCAFIPPGLTEMTVGFESSSKPGVCQTTADVSSSSGFFCRCLGKGALPGLALALPTDATCDSSCAQPQLGLVGTAVALSPSSSQNVCIAHTDIGSSNRFSSTIAGTPQAPVTCAVGANVLSGSNFSCVCQYASAPVVPTVAGDPRVAAQSLATLGR